MTNLYFPCPACQGVEGCDHAEPERKEAYTRLRFYAALGEALIKDGTFDRMSDLDSAEYAERVVNKFVKKVEPILDAEYKRRQLRVVDIVNEKVYGK